MAKHQIVSSNPATGQLQFEVIVGLQLGGIHIGSDSVNKLWLWPFHAVYIHLLCSSPWPDKWGHTIRDHWKALPFAFQLRQDSFPVYYDMYVKVKILPQCVGDGRTYAQYAVMLQDSACFSLGLWAFHADRDEMSQLTSLSSWTFFVIVISKC